MRLRFEQQMGLECPRHLTYFGGSSNQSFMKSGPRGPLFFFIWRRESAFEPE